eukprot:9498153-Pyramimonas_sp.AAC.1
MPQWPKPITAACAYLYHSEGLSRRSPGSLKCAGEILEGQHLATMGCDCNPPDYFGVTGAAAQSQIVILKPPCGDMRDTSGHSGP